MSRLPKPQYLQPWQYGHAETKKTGLHLHNLEMLVPTKNVYDEMVLLPKKIKNRVHYLGGGSSKERSITFKGVAEAMAEQWGNYED